VKGRSSYVTISKSKSLKKDEISTINIKEAISTIRTKECINKVKTIDQNATNNLIFSLK
jgi:hypothetical protein